VELADVITKAVMQAVLDAGDRMHDEGSDKVRTMKEIANDIKKRLAGSKAEKEEMKRLTEWMPDWGVMNKQIALQIEIECRICICSFLYFEQPYCPKRNHQKCNWLRHNGGRSKDKRTSHWKRAAEEHEEGKMRKWCADHAKNLAANPLAVALALQKEKARYNI
jgi:hypothetical protein